MPIDGLPSGCAGYQDNEEAPAGPSTTGQQPYTVLGQDVQQEGATSGFVAAVGPASAELGQGQHDGVHGSGAVDEGE